MKQLITQATVQLGQAGRYPVDRKGSVILAGYICIKPAIVLLEVAGRGIAYGVLRDIWNVRESAADARATGVHIGKVLLAQAAGQRRTDVQAQSRNRVAIYALDETCI